MLFHKSLYKKTFVLTVDNKKQTVLLLDVLTQIRKIRAVKERNVDGYAVIFGNPKDLDDDEITFERGEGPTSIETNGKYFFNKEEVTTNEASSDTTEENLNLKDFEMESSRWIFEMESSEHPSRKQNFKNQAQRKSKQQPKSTQKTPLRRSRRIRQRN